MTTDGTQPPTELMPHHQNRHQRVAALEDRVEVLGEMTAQAHKWVAGLAQGYQTQQKVIRALAREVLKLKHPFTPGVINIREHSDADEKYLEGFLKATTEPEGGS